VKEQRTFAAAPIIVALLFLSALMVPYVVGYFWLSNLAEGLGVYARPRVVRVYNARFLAEIFHPAAMIESAVSPHDVTTAPRSGPLLSSK